MSNEPEFKFHPDFFSDLEKLSKVELESVNKQIEKIKQNPLRFKRLKGRENCYSVRSGDLRIIYYIEGETTWFLLVERRDDVYEIYLKRLHQLKTRFL